MQKEMKVLRLAMLCDRVGLSKATIYDWMAKGQFPKSRQLGPNCVGWLEVDIEDWIAQRPARR